MLGLANWRGVALAYEKRIDFGWIGKSVSKINCLIRRGGEF